MRKKASSCTTGGTSYQGSKLCWLQSQATAHLHVRNLRLREVRNSAQHIVKCLLSEREEGQEEGRKKRRREGGGIKGEEARAMEGGKNANSRALNSYS